MTNEQREAIELAKEFTKMDFSNPMGWTGYYDAELEELSQAIETVLSLIKEQQEEIEKKDKIIDLMAEEIIMTKPANCTRTNEFNTEKVYMSKEEIKQYFTGLVEKE